MANEEGNMDCSRTIAGLRLLLVVGLLVGPIVARAQGIDQRLEQEAPDSGRPRTFGTPTVSHAIQAFAFTGFTAADSDAFASTASGSRFCTSAPCFFEAAVQLPAGALVAALELAACDTNVAGSVIATLFRTVAPDGPTTVLATAGTGEAAVLGCTFPFQLLMPAHAINNFTTTYFVQVRISGTTNTTRFQAVRISYNLQVSPAPALATFNDVPTSHPFFQFIQALAAAGITGGCSASPPLYCPDAAITRGQMAVFISRALGLQFGP